MGISMYPVSRIKGPVCVADLILGEMEYMFSLVLNYGKMKIVAVLMFPYNELVFFHGAAILHHHVSTAAQNGQTKH